MDITTLQELPPWEWPEEAAEHLLSTLRNAGEEESRRCLAAELAGEVSVINDELAEALLAVGQDPKAPEALRLEALHSLGPGLECADIEGFDDPEEMVIAEKTFLRVLQGLRNLYEDSKLPDSLRQTALEASVHAPQEWHPEAIHKAFSNKDERWKLTAVFCMGFLPGFQKEILEALKSRNEDIHHEAIIAAGNWEVEEAWPHIAGLVTSKGTDKYLLMAAIEAAAAIRPQESLEILAPHLLSDDEDIVDMTHEAMAMAQGQLEGEDDDEEDEETRLRRDDASPAERKKHCSGTSARDWPRNGSLDKTPRRQPQFGSITKACAPRRDSPSPCHAGPASRR